MKLVLYREESVNNATLSRLCLGNSTICDVLEDVVREVEGQAVEEWKVHGATAIPAGTYKVTLENSGRFGPNTITLNKVPGFTAIRGHAGNTSADTEGCLLFGTRNSSNTVAHSRDALTLVKDLVIAAIIVRHEEVTIEIVPYGRLI